MHSVGSAPVEFGSDASLFVEFFRAAERNNFRSTEAGIPQYDSVVMVKIVQPGERDAAVMRATDLHKMRFPRQWEAFENQQDQQASGMPLVVLYDGQPDLIANLKAAKIHTVEQLAGLTEQAIDRMGRGGMPMRHMVAEAKELLDGMNGAAGVQKLRGEVKEKDARIRTLEQQLREVGDRLSALEAKKGSE